MFAPQSLVTLRALINAFNNFESLAISFNTRLVLMSSSRSTNASMAFSNNEEATSPNCLIKFKSVANSMYKPVLPAESQYRVREVQLDSV